ncbi:hypothetical protein [Devosia sp.]|uniref:hypothetical protein n=1 Tax=Devosia sp. TaxID=1871048 RepID=UPI00261FBCED|nr:hypothetical protein [Devosia sp.]
MHFIVDVDNAVIDGAVLRTVRTMIAKRVREKAAQLQSRRSEPFTVIEGAFGHFASALIRATIPLIVGYSDGKDFLLKDSFFLGPTNGPAPALTGSGSVGVTRFANCENSGAPDHCRGDFRAAGRLNRKHRP